MIDLLDANLKESYILSEVMRCLHISLLCVQHFPQDRPTMPSVLVMLESEKNLPQPKKPGFFLNKDLVEAQFSSVYKELSSTNELTITLPIAR